MSKAAERQSKLEIDIERRISEHVERSISEAVASAKLSLHVKDGKVEISLWVDGLVDGLQDNLRKVFKLDKALKYSLDVFWDDAEPEQVEALIEGFRKAEKTLTRKLAAARKQFEDVE